MTDKPEELLSPAMMSALQAVTRMKGDSHIVRSGVLAEDERDDRYAPLIELDPQQGWKPAGR